jgi:peptide deformylase
MALLQILEFPDPRLRTRAQPVTQVDAALRTLIDDMFETMYAAPGIGLAATQVNVAKRVLVIDLSEKHDQPLALINPELLERSGIEETEEGCLSVPGYFDKVTRAEKMMQTASRSSSTRTDCSPSASSTRSIISTASCSSTTCRS